MRHEKEKLIFEIKELSSQVNAMEEKYIIYIYIYKNIYIYI